MRYLIPALFFCFLTFSQTKDTIYNNKTKNSYNFSLKLDSLAKIKPNLDYHFKGTNSHLFSIYNQNSQLNDIYYCPKDAIYFVKSINTNTNQLIPKDSFNPNGAPNLGTGLIMGSLKTVFNYKFKL